MTHSYDQYGWHTEVPNPDRDAGIAPPDCPNGQRPNWTGHAWVCAVYTPPPEPVAPPAPPVDMRVTQVAFKRRLTSTERIAIRTLAAANATAFDFMDLLDSSVVVNLDDHDVIAGITMFEQVGVLPVGRASVILTSPILDSERP